MADSILRLRVQSDEYDNKLKRATEQLTRYADGCRKAGGTLQYVDDNVVEFARSLGRMETTATTARGKVVELTKSYTELAVQYKTMADEEKKGEYGEALAQSLDELRGRIQQGKSQLDDINNSINSGGGLTGALDGLSEKFGMSIKSLAGWGTALTAGKAALDVAKDAFFASEATVDEWGRVMDSSKSLYEGFLTALNTGDISGYLSRIDDIVQAARTAYNELDRLGTMKTIQAPQMSAQQTENERMRMMIQTGRYIAPIDRRKSTMQNGQLLTPGQIRRIEQQLQNGMQKVVTLVGNEVTQTGRAIDAVYNRQAQELGMSLKEFRKGTSSMAEFDKRIKGAEDYRRYEREHTTYDERTGIGHRDASANPFEQFAKWSTFRVDGQRYNDLVKLIQQRDQQAGQAYSMQSQAYRTMNRAEGVTVRQLMGGGSGGGGRSGGKTQTIKTEEQLNNENIQKLTQEYIYASDARQASIRQEIKVLQERNAIIKQMKDEALGKSGIPTTPMPVGIMGPMVDVETKLNPVKGIGITQENPFEKYKETVISIKTPLQALTEEMKNLSEAQALALTPEQWSAYQKQIEEVQKKMGTFKGDGKSTAEEWGGAAQAINAVGSAMSSIEDPAAKVMGTIAQAIATIALTYAKSLEKTFTPWDWIAAAASGAATMISVISSIHSATGYANGGIVKGNSYSGDNIPAMIDGGAGGFAGLNAGEIVLNKAAQGNLASQLQGAGFGGVNMVGEISGEAIKIVLNRHLKRTGQGEIVTW